MIEESQFIFGFFGLIRSLMALAMCIHLSVLLSSARGRLRSAFDVSSSDYELTNVNRDSFGFRLQSSKSWTLRTLKVNSINRGKTQALDFTCCRTNGRIYHEIFFVFCFRFLQRRSLDTAISVCISSTTKPRSSTLIISTLWSQTAMTHGNNYLIND